LKVKKLAAFLRLNAIAISGASRTKKPFQASLPPGECGKAGGFALKSEGESRPAPVLTAYNIRTFDRVNLISALV
jgi:hypothetical protein